MYVSIYPLPFVYMRAYTKMKYTFLEARTYNEKKCFPILQALSHAKNISVDTCNNYPPITHGDYQSNRFSKIRHFPFQILTHLAPS